jgi:archaellum component FlaF (FlaF/FlaG flagellin family)
MKKPLAMFTLFLTLTLQPLLVTMPVNVTYASPTTLELVNPINGTHLFNFTTSQKAVGDTFLINVTVTDVADLFSWQIGVGWDPTLLNFSRIVKPSDMVFAGKAYLEALDTSTPGYVVYGQALVNPADAVSTARGTLCQIELKIIKAPLPGQTLQCDIAFENLGTDTFMLNKNGFDISFTPINAQYKYTAPWTPPPPATIYLNPQKVVDISLTPGSTFNVSLQINGATDLHLWSLNIVFNGTILNVSNAFEGDFLKSAGATTFKFQQTWLNATHKALNMNCSLVNAVGQSGSGKLAEITFQVLEFGSTALKLMDVQLLNSLGIQLPFNAKDGFFSNMLIAKLSIEPPEVRGPQYVPGTTFKINVTLSDVENLKTCIFNLTYNPSIIQEILINIPPVAGKTPTKKLVVDDTAGYIYANLTYKGGITVYGQAPVMNVEFQVLSAGVSPINLTHTALYNINNEAISHEVYHGIFIGLIRDIAITDVETDLTVAYQGWQVKINVTVKNKGNVTETFDVKIYANSTLITSETVTALEPAANITLTLVWNTATAQPCNIYKISAQAGPVPYEINTADNFLEDGLVKVRFMGDVNGDGKVDMRDVTAEILCFRAYPGHPKWDPEMDLDRNRIIDMRDIVLIVINFNKAC